MLSRETLEMYRRMTPGERLKLTLEAMRNSIPHLLSGSPEIVKRRFERIRQQNDLFNLRVREGLAAAERRRERT